jgi:tetratricopeptide (TPR) repeat protein
VIGTALASIGAVSVLTLALAASSVSSSPVASRQTPSASSVPAQSPISQSACSTRADLEALLARSEAAYNARDSQRGFALLQQAFEQATANGCIALRSEALRRLAIADSFNLRYAAAEQKLREVLPIFRQLGDRAAEGQTLTQLGGVILLSGRSRESVAPLMEARAIAKSLGDTQGLLPIYDNLVYAMAPGPDKDALRSEALQFMRSVPAGRAFECNVLHQWGDELFMQDKYGVAFTTLTEAAGCFEEVHDVSRLGRTYVSLGRVYRAHGRLDAALEQYTKALGLQQAAGDQVAAIQSLNAIGVTLGFVGRYDEALERLREALGIARRIGSERNIPFLGANIAALELDLGRYRLAADELERAIAEPLMRNETARLADLARAYVGLKEPAHALQYAERAVAAAGDSPSERIDALSARAEALEALGRFEDAASDLGVAVRAVEEIRGNTVPDDFLKRGFGQTYQWLFSSTISLLQAQKRPREALETAEQARARAFLDLLASRRKSETTASAAESNARGAAPATFDGMVAAAGRAHSTLVTYWVGKAATFVWVVDARGRISTARIDVTATDLVSLVRQATGVGGAAGSAGVLLGGGSGARLWRELYRLLVQPIRQHLPTAPGSRLTIVPHGPLFGLPFAALRDNADRYLVESYDIHYVPAVGALSYTSKPPTAIASALLVGDPGPDAARDRVMPLPPLPWANREVDAINRLLPTKPTVLTGMDATEERVRTSLAGKTLLHFATHGIVQNEERLSSYLALRPSGDGNDTATDGRLTANETYDLHLDADLIVLSGCRTALGPIMGDGVIGFTRAFLAAGASSVVATMWDVPDQTSFEVMRRFYGAWVAGTDKSRALRQAQLAVLRALRAGQVKVDGVALPESPRLWAGYVLVGQP